MFIFGCTTSAYAQEPAPLVENNVSSNLIGNQNDYQGFSRFAALASKDSENSTLKVSEITESSAKLKWNRSSVGVSYDIFVLNPISQSYELLDSTAKNHYKVVDLCSNSKYSFVIGVQNSNVIVGSATFVTKAQKPTLSVNDISSNSVELDVDNVQSNAVVDIYRGTTASTLKKVGTVKGSNSYVDNKLKSKTKYVYKAVATSKRAKSKVNSKSITVSTPKSMGLPKVSGKTKTYAYYTAVTVKSSPQYKLLNSSKCYTDPKTGIRMVDDCYCIALGSYYGSKIGTKYKITLSTGKSFNAILCDQKANRHTDSKNQYAMRNRDIIEFYVQKGKIPKGVRGDYGRLEQFKGTVVKIEKF